VPKQGETARRPAWPEDAVFRRLVLDVESELRAVLIAAKARGSDSVRPTK